LITEHLPADYRPDPKLPPTEKAINQAMSDLCGMAHSDIYRPILLADGSYIDAVRVPVTIKFRGHDKTIVETHFHID